MIIPYAANELNSYRNSKFTKFIKLSSIIYNVILIVYFGLIHQRGPQATISQIKNLFGHSVIQDSNLHVLLLMPCYSLPMYAAMHPYYKIHIRMLDCGINFENVDKKMENNEVDELYANPERWLNQHWFSKQFYKSDLIIVYEHIYHVIEPFLMVKGYERAALILHTIFTSSPKQNTRIVISRRMK